VTTTEITHATPAGFAANAWLRDNSLTIAGQYFERKVDVLLGGGASFFDPRRRRDRRNLAGEFQAAGYDVVQDRASLEAAPLGDRMLGVFAGGHLPFTIDHQQDEKLKARVPTLAEMTRAALARLGKKDRFILQVEGGRVDHAAHNSDAATAFYEQIALDEAIEVCLAYQEENPETLVVLTTDHGNSNFGLNGTGQGYGQSSARLGFARQVKASFPIILDRLKKLGTRIEVPGAPGDRNDVVVEMKPPYVVEDPSTLPQDLQPEPEEPKEEKKSSPSKPSGLVTAWEVSPKIIADVIGEATGFSVSAQRAERFARYLAGENPPIYEQMNSETMQIGQLMANRLAVGFTGSAHTADYVPIVAIGPGAERFQGFIDNTQVFTNFTELAGIRFRNPTLPLISDNGSPSAHERIASYAEPPEEIA
jgi:alkaline phosphatase